MKRKNLVCFLILLCSVTVPTVKADYFGLLDDNITFNKDSHVEKVNMDDEYQEGTIILHAVKNKKNIMNGRWFPTDLEKSGKRVYISRGVNVSVDVSTVRTGSNRGKSISDLNSNSRKAQIERQAAFAAARQERQRRAAQAAAKRRAEEQRRDNERAARTEVTTHARLQGRTNANIAKDYYNAGVGSRQARQTARETANALKVGPQRIERHQPKMSGKAYAASIKKQSQRDRTRREQNTAMRKPVRPVQRISQDANGNYVFTGRATKTSIHVKPDPKIASYGRDYNAPSSIKRNQGFRLSPNAVVTTGQPISIPELSYAAQRKIPEPYTRLVKTKELTHEELMEMKIKEFLQ